MVTRRRLTMTDGSPSSSPRKSPRKCHRESPQMKRKISDDSPGEDRPSKVTKADIHSTPSHDQNKVEFGSHEDKTFKIKSFYSSSRGKGRYLNPLERQQLSIKAKEAAADQERSVRMVDSSVTAAKSQVVGNETMATTAKRDSGEIGRRKSIRKQAVNISKKDKPVVTSSGKHKPVVSSSKKNSLTADQVLNLVDINSPSKGDCYTYCDDESSIDSMVCQLSAESKDSAVSHEINLQENQQAEVSTSGRKFFKSNNRRRSIDNSAITVSKGFNLKFTPKNVKKSKQKQSLSTGKKKKVPTATLR